MTLCWPPKLCLDSAKYSGDIKVFYSYWPSKENMYIYNKSVQNVATGKSQYRTKAYLRHENFSWLFKIQEM